MNIKTIPSAPDYEASDCGSIFSKERIIMRKNGWPHPVRRRKLKPATDGCGYQRVAVIVSGKLKTLKVHRVICETFLGESSMQVNHKDGDKENNNISNLEYCTGSENVIHAIKNYLYVPRIGQKNSNSKIDDIQALTIKTFLGVGSTQRKLAKAMNVSRYIIQDISRGKTWTHL